MADTNTTASMDNGFSYYNLPIIIISIVGLVSNLLLLLAFIKDPLKCFRNSGTYLLINLSTSDFMTCIFCLALHITPRINVLYPYFSIFVSWVGLASFVSITSVSIDRFVMVTYAMKYRILMNGKVMTLWISAIWIVSCPIPLFQLLSDRHGLDSGRLLYIFSVIIIIPSSVMYSSTYYKLKKQSRSIVLQNSNGNHAQEIRILKEKRFLRTIIIIASIAFVCFIPYLAFTVLYSYLGFIEDNRQAFLVFHVVCISIFYINFAVNPSIYVLRLPNYRKTFYILYCRRKTASQ